MCKKTYMTPEALVTLLATDFHLCQGSINGDTPTSGLDNDPLENGGNNPGDFSRRRGRGNARNQWEDDEMDEEQW